MSHRILPDTFLLHQFNPRREGSNGRPLLDRPLDPPPEHLLWVASPLWWSIHLCQGGWAGPLGWVHIVVVVWSRWRRRRRVIHWLLNIALCCRDKGINGDQKLLSGCCRHFNWILTRFALMTRKPPHRQIGGGGGGMGSSNVVFFAVVIYYIFLVRDWFYQISMERMRLLFLKREWDFSTFFSLSRIVPPPLNKSWIFTCPSITSMNQIYFQWLLKFSYLNWHVPHPRSYINLLLDWIKQ